MRLTVASKSLKGKHVRVLVPFALENGKAFYINEIVMVTGMYRGGIHVRADDGRVAYHVPVRRFELAEAPVPTARSRVAAPVRKPRYLAWVRGKLTFDGDHVPHVGGESLARAFAEFEGKYVRISLVVGA